MVSFVNILNDFINLIYPKVCAVCGESLLSHENGICTHCLYNLPKTDFIDDKDNPVNMLFRGRVLVENATSYFKYTKGSDYRHLIYKLKYEGQKEVGYELGKRLGRDISDSECFDAPDIIVPIPLHKRRLRERGYNQSEIIARGISEVIDIPVDTQSVYRAVYTQSQTNRSRYERWENVREIFKVKDETNLINKHILLVDDLVTTGSTLEACATTILEVEGTRVSIATLAVA